jgi:hypothetical protein
MTYGIGMCPSVHMDQVDMLRAPASIVGEAPTNIDLEGYNKYEGTFLFLFLPNLDSVERW